MGRSSRRHLVAFVWIGLCSGSANGGGLELHVIPVEGETRTEPTRIAAVVSHPEEVVAALGSVARVAGRERVDIELHRYPQLEPTDPAEFRASSFVIDFDADSVRTLFATRAGPGASDLAALVRRTDAAIPVKSMRRGWDLASQVAARGEGDCTEHAVLLAALARAAGRPARVVFGVLFVRDSGDRALRAYGHAWVEIRRRGRWSPVDATPLPGSGTPIYLPLALLADEGPGYALGLARSLQRGWVRRIAVLEGRG